MTSADIELLRIFLASDEFAEDPNHEGNEALMDRCRYCRCDLKTEQHGADCRIWTARNVLRDAQEYLFPRD